MTKQKETTTTIRIRVKSTKKRLDSTKLYPRETYDDLINRILDHFEGDGKL